MCPAILPVLRQFCLVSLVLVASCAFILPSRASATVIPVYSTDFSTDPGWDTNNPVTNYYDSEKGMYHYYMVSGTGAYVNVPVTYGGESFTLAFDILPERTDHQASVTFGLGDSDQITDQRLTMFTEFENGEYGRIIWIRSIDLMNQRREASSYFLSYGGPTVHFADGVWYHAIMEYRKETRSLTLSVYQRNDSRPVWHYTLDSMSEFPTMNRIYMSKVGDSGNPSAIAEGYLDNVAFSLSYPPETQQPAAAQATPVPPGPAQGTTTAAAVPPAGGSPAPGAIPLSVLPALGALTVAILGMGAARARRRR